MPTRSSTRCRTLFATALIAVCTLPTMAQKTGGFSTNLYDDYFGPVDPLPNDCNFSGHIIDGVPRVRPLLQKPTPTSTSTRAQVVPLVFPGPGYRQVAYSYSFTRLRLVFPPIYGGKFLVQSVRTTVHTGPNSSFPIASDRTVTGSDSVNLANSVSQHLTSGTGAAAINDTWLVRNITSGYWRSDPYAPLTFARVNMDCMMTVMPAATPVLQ